MPKVVDSLKASARPLLWLDDHAYSARLLAGGAAPWLDTTAYVAFRRQAIGLLRPDFDVVPVAGFARAWIDANPESREAIAAKKRTVAPVRTLLADEGLRRHLDETVRALRVALPALPLVLAMPSPRAWIGEAYESAFGNDVEVGADEVDACAVSVADFCRAFAESGVDAVLFEERERAEPASSEEIGWYQPVFNVARHYRWDVGLRFPSASGFSGTVEGPDFVIGPVPVAGPPQGLALPSAFWNGAAAPDAALSGFRFAAIPGDAAPETVLERLASLR